MELRISKQLLLFALVPLARSLISSYQRLNTSCLSSQFWNGQTCVNCQNEYCTCTTPLGCDSMKCPTGTALTYIDNIQQCSSCPNGCTSCTSGKGQHNFKCTSCSTSYQPINSICVSLTSKVIQQQLPFEVMDHPQQMMGNIGICAEMDDDTTFCMDCLEGYFLNEVNLCEQCVTGCLSCTSRGTCIGCRTQHYWQPFCQQTQQETQNLTIYGNNSITIAGNYLYGSGCCQRCSDPYAMACDSSGYNATICGAGFTLMTKGASQTCVKCPKYCADCSEQQKCTQCDIGSFLVNGNCTLCPGNNYATLYSPCTQCSSTNICDVCNSNVGYLKLGPNCVNCASQIIGCVFCNLENNQTSCLVCENGFYRSLNTQGVATCISCDTLQDGAQLCYKDDYSVQPKPIITQCENSYLLTKLANQTIQSYTCTPNVNCLTMIDSGGQCSSCVDKSQIIFNGQCTNCSHQIIGCQKCQISGSTLKCVACLNGQNILGISNYALDTDSNSCVKCLDQCATCTPDQKCTSCKDGYFLNNNNCSLCAVSNCQICQSTQSSCEQCFQGYFSYSSNGASFCLPCPLGCSKCDSQGSKCTQCFNGYYLKNDGCNLGTQYCSVMNSDGSCSDCYYGFRKMNGRCYPCIADEEGFVCGKNAGDLC